MAFLSPVELQDAVAYERTIIFMFFIVMFLVPVLCLCIAVAQHSALFPVTTTDIARKRFRDTKRGNPSFKSVSTSSKHSCFRDRRMAIANDRTIATCCFALPLPTPGTRSLEEDDGEPVSKSSGTLVHAVTPVHCSVLSRQHA